MWEYLLSFYTKAAPTCLAFFPSLALNSMLTTVFSVSFSPSPSLSAHLCVCLTLVYVISFLFWHREITTTSDSLCEASPVSLIDSPFHLPVGDTVGGRSFINLLL